MYEGTLVVYRLISAAESGPSRRGHSIGGASPRQRPRRGLRLQGRGRLLRFRPHRLQPLQSSLRTRVVLRCRGRGSLPAS